MRNRLAQAFRRWCCEDYDASWASIAISVSVLCLISLSMLWLGEKFNGENLALTRYMARVQAPMAAHFYPDKGQEQISVLLYDNAFVRQYGPAWPISYGVHADWLDTITRNPQARPKAVFMDITFGQPRIDASLDKLIDTLCRIREERNVPVFLAALARDSDAALSIRPDMMSARGTDGEHCFTLVGESESADPLDGIAWTYPLTWRITDDAHRLPGPPQPSDRGSYMSAAARIAQDAGGIDLGIETGPMAFVWGPSERRIDTPSAWEECDPSLSLPALLVPGPLRDYFGMNQGSFACPTHPTLFMSDVAELSSEALAPYTKDRYVFIGASVSAYDDYAESPVQGRVLGIYAHAMALDNLIVYGKRYPQQVSWVFPPAPGLLVPAVITVTTVFGVHLVLRRLGLALVPFVWKQTYARFGASKHALQNKWVRVLLRMMGWAIRVWFQVVIALVMIVLMQYCFRIGMLPLMELIGMTLLAEGLGYVHAVRRFFAEPMTTEEFS